MDEIREAAVAYYENGSAEQKRLARDFFNCLDEDGDGKVEVLDVVKVLTEDIQGDDGGGDQLGDYSSFFQELGRESKGKLNFNGFLTLFYVIKSRSRPFCDGCRVFLKSMFFTCVQCHESSSSDTFDLCSKCYSGKKFTHDHAAFLDNYTLLARKRLLTAVGEDDAGQLPLSTDLTTSSGTRESNLRSWKSKSMPSSLPSSRLTRGKPKHEKVREAFEAFNSGFAVGNYVKYDGDACTIM